MDFTDIKAKLTAAAEENKRLADEKKATIEQIGQICRDNAKSIVVLFVKEMNHFVEYLRRAPCGYIDYEYKRHNLATDDDAPDCYEFAYIVSSSGIDLGYIHNGSSYWSKQFTYDSRDSNPQWESQHIQYISNWFGTEERCQELVEILAKEYAKLFSAYEQHFAEKNVAYADAIKELKGKLEGFHAIKTKEDGTVEIQLGGKTYIGTLKEQE